MTQLECFDLTSIGYHSELNTLYKNEIIPKYVTNPEEAGIIAPYKYQLEALEREFTEIDVATVHKFQGKEKDMIIISTVDDEITDFADAPYLVNMAVSGVKGN